MIIKRVEELQVGNILSKDVTYNSMVILREGTQIENRHKETLKKFGVEEVEVYTPPKPVKLSVIEERFRSIESTEIANVLKNSLIKFLQKRGLLIV